MNFLDNLNIKSKLNLLLIFPLLGFIVLGIYDISKSYKRYNSMNSMESLILLSTKLSFLVHETQKERGMTAGFLGYKVKSFQILFLFKELQVKKSLMF